jgi:hypothetical protein
MAIFPAKKRQLLSTAGPSFSQHSAVFYCSGYEELRAKRSEPGELLISHRVGKMGKDFLFYSNWCNFTEFLSLA